MNPINISADEKVQNDVLIQQMTQAMLELEKILKSALKSLMMVLNRKRFSSMLILDRIGLVRVLNIAVLGYSLNLSPNTLAPRKDVR